MKRFNLTTSRPVGTLAFEVLVGGQGLAMDAIKKSENIFDVTFHTKRSLNFLNATTVRDGGVSVGISETEEINAE